MVLLWVMSYFEDQVILFQVHAHIQHPACRTVRGRQHRHDVLRNSFGFGSRVNLSTTKLGVPRPALVRWIKYDSTFLLRDVPLN
jgi:hypothetical protein